MQGFIGTGLLFRQKEIQQDILRGWGTQRQVLPFFATRAAAAAAAAATAAALAAAAAAALATAAAAAFFAVVAARAGRLLALFASRRLGP